VSAPQAPRVPRLTLVTRAECGLCDEMHAQLTALARTQPLPELGLVDVDADPELQRRWGWKVPVLLLDGSRVCETRLDRGELLRLLRL
jgi:thioredoxin reductase (NADPH)